MLTKELLYLVYVIAGIGAGAVTGFAGLSAAVVITPLLVGVAGWPSYPAVTVALASDVLASLLSTIMYARKKNVDFRRGLIFSTSAFVGVVGGSIVGYLFTQKTSFGDDALGFISMICTLFLGFKFLLRPINKGQSADDFNEQSHPKERFLLAIICGLFIGMVCGFSGAGGGFMMLAVFTILLGYRLKTAVGTATLVMTIVAFVGALSHIIIINTDDSIIFGIHERLIPTIVIVLATLLAAILSARLANKIQTKTLNLVIGITLVTLAIFTFVMKMIFN